MGHTIGDAYIVAALVAGFLGWLYYKHVGRQRRMEMIHKERMAAMEKGIPLPEFPLDPTMIQKVPDPRTPLLHGIAWFSLGLGFVVALLLMGPLPNGQAIWMMPMPLVYLGAGLILYYVLATRKR